MPKTQDSLMKPVETEREKQFAVISPEGVRLFAQCAGCASATDFVDCELACSVLAQDLSHRLRQIIQLAAVYTRREGRVCLGVDQIDRAVRQITMNCCDPGLYGNRFQPLNRFLRVKGTDLFETEKFIVLLSGVAKNPLIINKVDLRFADDCLLSEWLNYPTHPPHHRTDTTPVDDENTGSGDVLLKPAHDAYLSALLACLLSGSAKKMAFAFKDLMTNSRLQAFLSRLLALLMAVIKTCSHDVRIILAALRAFQCLLANPLLTFTASKPLFFSAFDFCFCSLTGSLTFCQLGDEFSSDYVLLRELAARLTAEFLVKYSPLLGEQQTVALADRLISFVDQTLSHNAAKCYGPLVCLGYLAEIQPVCSRFLSSLASKICLLADLDNFDINLASHLASSCPPSQVAVLSLNGALSVFVRHFFSYIHYSPSSTFSRFVPYCHMFGELFGPVICCEFCQVVGLCLNCSSTAAGYVVTAGPVTQRPKTMNETGTVAAISAEIANKTLSGSNGHSSGGDGESGNNNLVAISITGCNNLPIKKARKVVHHADVKYHHHQVTSVRLPPSLQTGRLHVRTCGAKTSRRSTATCSRNLYMLSVVL